MTSHLYYRRKVMMVAKLTHCQLKNLNGALETNFPYFILMFFYGNREDCEYRGRIFIVISPFITVRLECVAITLKSHVMSKCNEGIWPISYGQKIILRGFHIYICIK